MKAGRPIFRPVLIVLAFVSLFGAGLGLADSASTVTMTSSGPQPVTVTVNWGGTVNFFNSDAIAHAIASSEPEIRTVTVAPAQTVPLTFTGKVGLKRYVMSGKPRSFYGPAVLVTLSGTLDLTARDGTVRFGQSTQLQGRLSLQPVGEVSIQQRPLNRFGNGSGAWSVVAGPFPTSGTGAFSYGATPAVGAEYEAVAAAGQLVSKPVTVLVTPAISVVAPKRIRVGRAFAIHINVSPPKATRSVDLEAYVPRLKRWHAIGHVALPAAGTAAVRMTVPAGTMRLRVAITGAGIAGGLTAGTSKPFTVVGLP
jgi:hypothetical protein